MLYCHYSSTTFFYYLHSLIFIRCIRVHLDIKSLDILCHCIVTATYFRVALTPCSPLSTCATAIPFNLHTLYCIYIDYMQYKAKHPTSCHICRDLVLCVGVLSELLGIRLSRICYQPPGEQINLSFDLAHCLR
jgi:hypothetical protein